MSSGRIMLDGEFKRGKTDKIMIDSPEMLSPLSEILIGHDNGGSGPGWFLDRVDVECHVIGMKQIFPCNKWLAKDEGDGRIERLAPVKTAPVAVAPASAPAAPTTETSTDAGSEESASNG